MEWMNHHWQSILLFTLIHFSLGRSFSVFFAIVTKMPVFFYFPAAFIYDYVQIPLYGFVLEHSSRRFLPVQWVKKKMDILLSHTDRRPILKRVMSLGNVGLILISALPIRGFGILSASIVSFFLKKGRKEGTLLIMTGSLIGILIVMGIVKGIFQVLTFLNVNSLEKGIDSYKWILQTLTSS